MHWCLQEKENGKYYQIQIGSHFIKWSKLNSPSDLAFGGGDDEPRFF